MRWFLLAFLAGCGASATPEVDEDPLRAAIKAQIKKQAPVLKACKRHWVKGRDAVAELQLALTVSADGKVETASLSGADKVDETFRDCLREEAATWTIDIEQRATRTMRVPLNFAP
jgi:hypothetical protein